ncbi:hypothetical protein CMK12_06265 [Candidatus Poribacteria bacterium]|nr:hypothetical protein [Candidatus Poribacteria bacterium]
MKHIKLKGKQFVLALKSNRLIALNQKDPQRGEFKKLSELECRRKYGRRCLRQGCFFSSIR